MDFFVPVSEPLPVAREFLLGTDIDSALCKNCLCGESWLRDRWKKKLITVFVALDGDRSPKIGEQRIPHWPPSNSSTARLMQIECRFSRPRAENTAITVGLASSFREYLIRFDLSSAVEIKRAYRSLVTGSSGNWRFQRTETESNKSSSYHFPRDVPQIVATMVCDEKHPLISVASPWYVYGSSPAAHGSGSDREEGQFTVTEVHSYIPCRSARIATTIGKLLCSLQRASATPDDDSIIALVTRRCTFINAAPMSPDKFQDNMHTSPITVECVTDRANY